VSAFGELLRRHRQASEFSQEELAERARISTAAVGALERGLRRAPRSETIALLAEALNLSAPARAELEGAAKRGRARFGARAEPAVARPAVPKLPLATTTFLGRDAESAALRALLLERGQRLVTITGSGGVGKSRLALETLRALAPEFEDGVFLVRLARIVDPAAVVLAIVDELGLSNRGGRPPIELVRHELSGQRVLLALDNCEHQLGAVADVAQAILATCPEVALLATSRERLRVAGEVTFDLAALAYPPESAGPADALQYPAIRLFVERANALSERPFEFGAGDLRAIYQIVRDLDGLPLAIELAVPTLRVLNVSELAKRLKDRFRLLSAGERDALPHHRSLRALIDWSYERLTSDERGVFAACAVFAGSFTLAAIVSLCASDTLPEGEALAVFASLVEKSLVRVSDRTAGRYDLSSLIKEYATGIVRDRTEREALSLRHARYYLDLARDINSRAERLPPDERVRLMKRDAPNFEAALRWTLGQRGEPETGSHLALELRWFFYHDSHLRSQHWFETALHVLDSATYPALAAKVTVALAYFTQASAEMRNLVPNLERAVAFRHGQPPSLEATEAAGWLAYALASAGRAAEARSAAAESVALARALKDPRMLSWALRNHAAIMLRSNLEQQRELLEESLRVYVAGHEHDAYSEVLSALGQVAFFSGDIDSAIALTQQTKDARGAPLGGDNARSAARLGNIAAYSLTRHDVDTGIEIAREALEHSLSSGDPILTACIIQHLAYGSAIRGNASRAARLLGFVRARADAMNEIAMCLENYLAERIVELLDATLPEDERAALMRTGATWSEDRAVEEAFLVT
jgi:predicted ATPase/DNA-binding XRE family transcriptional regulator